MLPRINDQASPEDQQQLAADARTTSSGLLQRSKAFLQNKMKKKRPDSEKMIDVQAAQAAQALYNFPKPAAPEPLRWVSI
jgi:hypothetical protein